MKVLLTSAGRDQVLVEATGLLGFGMDQQAAAADGIVEAGDPGDPIDQQQTYGRCTALMYA